MKSVSMETCVLHCYDYIGFKSALRLRHRHRHRLRHRLRYPYSSASNHFELNKISCIYPKLLLLCAVPSHSPTKHATLLLDTFHQHHTLKSLLSHLHKKDFCPFKLLQHQGDWKRDHFWVVVKFLSQASRSHQILKVLLLPFNISFT